MPTKQVMKRADRVEIDDILVIEDNGLLEVAKVKSLRIREEYHGTFFDMKTTYGDLTFPAGTVVTVAIPLEGERP